MLDDVFYLITSNPMVDNLDNVFFPGPRVLFFPEDSGEFIFLS